MSSSKQLLVLILLPLTIQACGYTLAGRGSALPPDIKTISIPLFANKTGEPELDTIITTAIRDQFIQDGRLTVYDSSNANATLTGILRAVNIRALAYDSDNRVTEMEVNIDSLITFTDNHSKKILQSQQVKTKWNYVVDPSITVAEALRLEAIRSASENLAESIVSLVIEAF